MATHLHNHGCGTSGDECCVLPAEFVRMRYYFGQRLGVVDLFDEQRYHAGKQRFHNLRAHGAGVLCGLTAERFVMPGTGTPTTILKVTRGAALDPCGREILVGVDQCIDVAAWFQKHRDRLEWEPGEHTLTVALCYRECPSDPGAAPRDPCGCDTGGCEFGRVREGFELKLLTDEQAEHCYDETFPTREDLGEALEAEDLGGALDVLVGEACPEPPDDDACLCLASFPVMVGGDPLGVTAVGEPDNTIPSRATLLSTAALQELLLRIVGGTGAMMFSGGPSFRELSFRTDAGTGELTLGVALLPGVSGTTPVPLAEATFDTAAYELRRFDGAKWGQPEAIQVAYDVAAGGVRIRWNAPQAGNYRLVVKPSLETPTVDRHMRPLGPVPMSRSFSLDGNPLQLDRPRF